MRYKIVPPVRDVAFLEAVRDALPRVPNSVEDCCSRIRDRTDVPSRDLAREYLTFAEALGLAAETDGAYYQAQDSGRDDLAARFENHVFGASEVLDSLDETEGKDLDTVFAEIEPLVPRWERHKDTDWKATWRERTERLCEWAVVFGLAEHTDGGYRATNHH